MNAPRGVRWISEALGCIRRPREEPEQRVVLMYHGVADAPAFNCVATPQFERQLRYAREHYHIVPLRDLVARLGEPGSGPYLAVTFDDAYENFATSAYPILRKLGIPATVFVPTAYVGGRNEWDIRVGHPPLPLMTWTQMRTLDPGLVDFGSHGAFHRPMSELSADEVAEEVRVSRAAIEDALGRPATLFAYPYGKLKDLHPDGAGILADIGYHGACSTRWGRFNAPEDRYRLRRIDVWDDDTAMDVEYKLTGYYDWLGPKEELAFRLRHRSRRPRLREALA